jgi:flagellar basal-body rod protein FlgB
LAHIPKTYFYPLKTTICDFWHARCKGFGALVQRAPENLKGRLSSMVKGIDSLFYPHSQALRVLEQRMGLLSGNLANASTPGYKARDLDFAAAMAAVENGAGVAPRASSTSSAAGHLPLGNGGGATVRYRTPLQASLDGNTVDAQAEKAAFAESAVRYESTLSLLSRRISGLRAVLKGE